MVVRKLCLSLGFILSQRLPHKISGSAARGIPSSSFNPGGNGLRSSRSIQTFQRGASETPLTTR
jgi:hypothetical protein